MSEPIQDEAAVNQHRRDDAVSEKDEPLEANVEARTCHVPVRPGYGQAAYRAGCEDEYIDRMNARYGGEW